MGRPISGNRPVDPQRRLFWKVCSGTVTTEHRRHRQFAHLRVRNELFEPGPDLLAWIEELAS